MRSLQDIEKVLSSNKTQLFSKYHLTEMGVFGSIARGDHAASSDVDIMIDYQGAMGLEFIDLAEELEQLLQTRVDLVSKRAIKPSLLSRINQDIVYV